MTLNIRPTDIPELRADLANQLRQPTVIRRMWPDGHQPTEDQRAMEAELVRLTATAEMFHISEDMADLAAEASTSLERFALQPEDVPCPAGLMLFDGEAPFEAPYDDGCKNELRGIAWYMNGGHVFAIPAVLPHGILGKGSPIALDPECAFLVEFGSHVETILVPSGGCGGFGVLGMLLTVWLLMGQTLAQCEQTEPDRAARKRLRRLNAEPGPVRVITLRRPKVPAGAGESSREYHYRWITRGHWRQQWYPARQVHRPVWIAPRAPRSSAERRSTPSSAEPAA
jgi:hypothetical protein